MPTDRPSRPAWDHPRSAVSALLLTRLGEEHGVPAEALLRDTGLRLDDLADPATEVSARQELTVITRLVEAVDAVGDSGGLGLVAGSRYHLTAYGLWGFMLLSSPTPRHAVDVALRYTDLTFAFARVEARQRAAELQLVITADDLPLAVQRFVIEREAAAICTLVREAFSPTFSPLRVEFAFAPPAPPTAAGRTWRECDLLGLTPTYDAEECLVVNDSAFLDDPMPQGNAHAAALALDQCRALLQRRRARAGTAGQVRDLLVGRLADPPDAEEVAATLGVGVRTLQRQLSREGTSFRALLDEVRAQLAEELLLSGGLTVAQVAERLGYVELSSFSQAFRRWKGLSPRAFVAARPAPSRTAW